jgi:alpha/beta superfamily hydrolase
VVESIVSTYREKGFTTLRFNFRGVGNSRGQFDDGIGEQKDIVAARSYLKEMGIKQIDLSGYSFGAWANAMVGCLDSSEKDMIMVSPPVAFVDFSLITALPCLKLVVTGSRDDIAPVHQINEMLPKWNLAAHLKIIDGADHFYGGYLSELKSVLSGCL